MHTIYANQTPPDTWSSAIFLAGPTPRHDTDIPSWRPEAIKHLKVAGFDGVVFVPEDEDGTWKHNYDDQIEWEEMCLNYADVNIFWIPRELTHMPAFTTNDEWGFWKGRDPEKLVLGTPAGAPKVRYQRYYAEKISTPVCDTLKETCQAAVKKISTLGEVKRTGGERCVPLHIWHTASFQSWYQNLKSAGNTLEHAHVEWVFRAGPAGSKSNIFFWILHVHIFIKAEGRSKTNEVVIARPDISTILLYEQKDPIEKSKVVLIKEFRNPVSNASGYVLELAGGSSWSKDEDSLTVAVEECREEVGIDIAPERFVIHQNRQLSATSLSHTAQLFSVALTSEEMDQIQKNSSEVRGVEADSERTWTEIYTYQELLENPNIDWSMLGMIAAVLQS